MPKTILVIDHDALAQQLIADILKLRGYRVLTSSDAHEGCELLKLKHDQVDLILCEIQLLDISGGVLRPRIVEWPACGTIPFIFTTMELELFPHIQQSGVFLGKPFHVDDLLNMVQRALGMT
jgi:CheY-like chemotaxis protein